MVAIPHLPKLKSLAVSFTRVFPVKKQTYLSAQLRESAPYLKDAGFRQTASLLVTAADEMRRFSSVSQLMPKAYRSRLGRLGRSFGFRPHRSVPSEVEAPA
jgi:hypothetical protein